MSMLGALILQNIDAGVLKNSLLSSTQQEQILKAKDTLVDQVFAEDPPAAGTQTATNPGTQEGSARIQEGLSEVAKVFASVAIFLVKIMGMLLMFMLYWMSDLMDNTFILDGAMGDKLQIIWIFVRNIINILFAIVLVVVAFINVAGYGAGEGNYALKKFLPKMALALIAVNFTFLGARIVLDVNNVLTTAVFALPQSVPDLGQFTASSAKPLKLYAKYRCSLNITDVNKWKQELATPGQNGSPSPETTSMSGMGDTGLYQLGIPIGSFFDICVADIQGSKNVAGADEDGLIEMGDMSQIRTNNFVWLMATRYQGIQNIGKVPLQAKDWEALLLNAGFGFAFAIIYAVAYLAMFIILLVRVVILWICIALSPLIAVEILFPELMGGMKIGESDLKTTFLNHAFVPLKMAIPMSIGFVMISQMSLVGLGDFTKSIVLTGGEFTRDGSLHRILYGVASAGLIWIGVFSASSGVYGKGLVDKIKGGAESIGKFVGKAPFQLIPIVPVAGKMLPVSAVGSMLRTIGEAPGTHAGALGREAALQWMPGSEGNRVRAKMSLDDAEASAKNNNVTNTQRNALATNWQHFDSAQQTRALRAMFTANTTLQLGTNETASQFFNSPNAEARMAWLRSNGVTQPQIDAMRGVAQPATGGETTGAQTAAASLASGLAGSSSISVKIDRAFEVNGAKLENTQNLNSDQLKVYFEQLIGDTNRLKTVLSDNANGGLRDAIADNASSLNSNLSSLTAEQKRNVAQVLLEVFQANKLELSKATAMQGALQSLGLSNINIASIQRS